MNYYDLLGITPNATYEEIRKSYLDLSKKYHPDVNSAKNATFLFTQIKNAYDTLSHPVLRNEYDMSLGLAAKATESREYRGEEPSQKTTNKTSTSSIIPFFVIVFMAAILIYNYVILPNNAIDIVKAHYINSFGVDTGPVSRVERRSDIHTVYGWGAQKVDGNIFFVEYGFDNDNDKSNGYRIYCFEVDLNSGLVREITGNRNLERKYMELNLIE